MKLRWVACGLVLLCAMISAARAAPPRPNIVFVLADDLGWMDVGCYGSRHFRTPHIDRLAARGVRFTDAYAASCVCSPTRASIMTGKYPARLDLTIWLGGRGGAPGARLRYRPRGEMAPWRVALSS